MKHILIIILLALAVVHHPLYGQDVFATVTDISQNSTNDGAIELSMNGGFAPFLFNWSGPNGFSATTKNITGLVAGQYCVTITDELCGTLILCRVVKKCDPIVAVYTGANCPYNSNAYIGLIFSGVAPFKIAWSDGYNTGTNLYGSLRTGLSLGVNYCVTVTSSTGCSEEMCRTIISPVSPIEISNNVTQPSCGNKGAITLGVTGGYTPYSFIWSDGVATKDRENLSPGTYCVTVTDNLGCTATRCYTMSQSVNNLKINLIDMEQLSSCSGFDICDASLSVAGSGGTPPYKYKWEGPDQFSSSQATISNLCKAGTYFVTVSDESGCTRTDNFKICCCDDGEPGAPSNPKACPSGILFNININANVNSATNAQGGTINLTVSGIGGEDFSLVWEKDGQFYSYSEDIANLSPGQYCVTVKSGCKKNSNCYTIVNCDNSTLSISGTTNPTCVSYSAGAVNLSVSGGVAPYTYKWSNGDQMKNLNNLPVGTYTVTVKDKNYCTKTQSFTIPIIEITTENQQCTRLTKCGNQVVSVQQFEPVLVFQPNCRFARNVCANGYISDPIFMGSTFAYGPGGPFGCQIDEFCVNGQLITSHIGFPALYSVGTFTNVGGCQRPGCVRVTACTYPSLDGFADPASILPAGAGTLAVSSATNCTESCIVCGIGTPGEVDNYSCDGTFFGTGCRFDPCAAFTGGNNATENTSTQDTQILDKDELKQIILEQFKKDFPTLPMHIEQGTHIMSEARETPVELTNTTLVNANRFQVFPNPFTNKFEVLIVAETETESLLEVLDLNGRVVLSTKCQVAQGQNRYALELTESLPDGLYILRETTQSGKLNTIKIIKY